MSFRNELSLPVRFLVSMVFYVVLVQTRVMESPVTASILALIPLALVISGFLYRLRYGCAVLLPPADGDGDFVVDGINAQPFPLAISYRVDMRNLYFLAVVPIYSFAVWSAAATGWLHGSDDNPFPVWGAMAGLFSTSYIAWRWMRERRLLGNGGCTLARIHDVVKSRVSYDYHDSVGERHGGSELVFGKVGRAEWRVPILVNMRWGADAMIFPAFFFHRFRMADTHHIPESQLVRVDPKS